MNSPCRQLHSSIVALALCFCGLFALTVTTRAAGSNDANSGNFPPPQTALSGSLLNISTRAHILTGDNVLIGGFIITGKWPKRVIIRGIGPSLAKSGIQGALADPVIELHRPDGKVITNDDWRFARAAVELTGIPPTNDKESAIVANLLAGNYTVVLRGKNNGTGIGLIEIYDLNTAEPTEMINISSRGFVEMDNNVLIGGIIVGPKGPTSSKLLIRAIGPSLAAAGVANPLLDPTLELHNGNGSLIASNNDWKDSQRAMIQATGAAPTNDKEAAIVFNAAPGNYTAIVRGKNNTTGVALVEVYNMH